MVEPLDRLGDRYRLVRQLGRGGMSVVWLGYDEVLRREVAIKSLAADVTADSGVRDVVRREALAAARVTHPNIVGVYDYGESADGSSYVVMELVRGQTLASMLANGSLPWAEAVRICASIGAALAAAHREGIAHRDVSPANVMVTTSGVKLVDFGISAPVGDVDTTPDNTVVGTPAYLAPERLDRTVVSPAADIYALGLVLYRCLVGRLPWDAGTVTQMLRAHYYVEPAPLPPIDGLPPAVAEVCTQCLVRQPEQRPDAVTIAQTLTRATGLHSTAALPTAAASATTAPLAASPPTARITQTVPVRRLRLGSAVAAMVGLLALLIGLLPTLNREPAQVRTSGRPADSTVGTSPNGCRVRYELQRNAAGRFTSAVTVRNTGAEDVVDWQLEFTFPGHQRLVEASATEVDWHQSGQTVVIRGPMLASGDSVTTGFQGEYDGTNAFPVQFRLNDTACQPTLVAASQTPDAGGNDNHRGKGKKQDEEDEN
ncbi:MAG: serine/threonine-protein kinase [Micromonosporaceae bacterium]